jgi:putative addiction module component (TIGR02574 family)
MTQVAEQLKSQLAELDEKDRAELAHFLIRSLDGEADIDTGVDDAWEEEILRRHAEIESGAVEAIPADEVFASIRARLK